MSPEEHRLLRRSRQNRIFAGVCGGLADFFGISAFWFRLAFLIALIPGGGARIFTLSDSMDHYS